MRKSPKRSVRRSVKRSPRRSVKRSPKHSRRSVKRSPKRSIKRSKRLFSVKNKGLLRDYGYSTSKPATERIRALNRAVKIHGKQEIYRHLRAIATYQKRTNPTANQKMVRDVAYLRQKYYPHRLKSGYIPKKR